MIVCGSRPDIGGGSIISIIRVLFHNKAFIALCALLACTVLPSQHAASAPDEDLEVVEIEEQWSVGGDGDDAMLFTSIRKVLQDKNNGDLYCLDTLSSTITVLSSDGVFLREIFLGGEGPGEVRKPKLMQWLNDGRIGLVDPLICRIVAIDKQGVSAQLDTGLNEVICLHSGSIFISSNLEYRDGSLFVTGLDPIKKEVFVASYSLQNSMNHRQDYEYQYLARSWGTKITEGIFDSRDRYWVNNVFCLAGDRLFIASDPFRYNIEIFEEGIKTGEIQKVYKVCRASNEQKRNVAYSMFGGSRTHDRIISNGAEIVELEKMFVILEIFENSGYIWVRTSEEHNFFRTYDLYDYNGRFHKRICIDFNGSDKDELYLFEGGSAVVVKGSWDEKITIADTEQDALEIVYCQLTKDLSAEE